MTVMETKIEIFKTPDNQTQIEVKFENDTIWVTQEQLSQLFQRDRSVISKHITAIFRENELVKELVCANFAPTYIQI